MDVSSTVISGEPAYSTSVDDITRAVDGVDGVRIYLGTAVSAVLVVIFFLAICLNNLVIAKPSPTQAPR